MSSKGKQSTLAVAVGILRSILKLARRKVLLNVRGQVVLITGGSRGLGLAIAEGIRVTRSQVSTVWAG